MFGELVDMTADDILLAITVNGPTTPPGPSAPSATPIIASPVGADHDGADLPRRSLRHGGALRSAVTNTIRSSPFSVSSTFSSRNSQIRKEEVAGQVAGAGADPLRDGVTSEGDRGWAERKGSLMSSLHSLRTRGRSPGRAWRFPPR